MASDKNISLLDFTVDNAPEAIYWVDEKGIIRNVNKAACEMLQYERDELIGMSVPQINPEFSLKSLRAHFDDLKKQKSTYFQSTQITKNGKEIPVEITSSITEVEGELMSCTYIRDISDIQSFEQIVELNEQRWKTGIEMLSEGVWDWDVRKDKVEFSAQWVKNFSSPGKNTGLKDTLKQLVHADDFKTVNKRLSDHLEGHTAEYRSRHRVKDSKGNWRWVRDRGRVISRSSDGKPIRMIGATQDITEIVDSEKQLRLSQEKELKSSHQSIEDIKDKFLNIFNHSNEAIFIGDPVGNKIIDVNPKACEILGYSKDELLQTSLSEIIPNQTKSFINFFSRVQRLKSAETDELVFKSKSGERIFAEVSASLFSMDGEEGILGIMHTQSDEGKFERVIGRVTEAAILRPDRGLISNFIVETAKVLRVKYAGMSRIIQENPLRVKVLTFWSNDHFGQFEYNVKGSPCENVVGGDFYCVEKNVKELYPNSELLEKFDAESYMAVPISDSKKNPLGHFFLCDDGLMERRSWIENLLRLGALRMRLEIERIEAQQALEEMNLNLEKKVEERTKELTKANADLEKAFKEVEELRDKLQAENIYLKEEIKLNHNFEDIISQDKGFRKVLNEVEKVAKTDSTVLILGETGTGKEVLTRSIHNISNRRNKPLVKVNCAALPATLIESELFGHEKGAYTGAVASRQGRFELADEGTIFLDEIGEVPIELQPKLLRALQEGEFERVGGVKTIKVNVRVIAATNRDLEKAIDRGEFRSDLFYRLNVFPINVPPLRERKGDIPLLVKHFISKYNQKLGNEVTQVPQGVINKLMEYSWPGNIRELENIIERAVIISEGKNLKIGDWLKGEVETEDDNNFKPLHQFEKEYIIKVLKSTNWKVSGKGGAAEILKMKPTTLESRMKKLGISR